MRLDTPNDSPSRIGAWLSELNGRQVLLILLSLGVLTACAMFGWQRYQERRSVFEGRMQTPPEVLEARRARGSIFASGMSREERREAGRRFGKDFWQRTSHEQKLEVARGYFPQLTAPLKLTPEQQGPVNKVLEGATNALLPIWDGWWNPNFNNAGAMLRTMMVVDTSRKQLEPLLTADQKQLIEEWMARAQQRMARDAPPSQPSTANTTTTGTPAPAG